MNHASNLVEPLKDRITTQINHQSNMNEYVVNGAVVACTRGSNSTCMVFKDRGYETGYGRVGLDTDTSAEQNFSNTFGCCKCTTETCKPLLAEKWIETAKCQNLNGGHPLLMKSMLVCREGGILYFKESGQNLGEPIQMNEGKPPG